MKLNKAEAVVMILALLLTAALAAYLLGSHSAGVELRVETAAMPTPIAAASGEASTSEEPLLDLNTATAQQLIDLPGIGEVLAQRILDYRQTVGGFTAKEELMGVSGIGEGIYAKVKDFITVAPATAKG